MKTNLSFTIRHLLRIFARSLAILTLVLTAQASLIYTDFSIASGSSNVGTFSIAESTLYQLSHLSQSGGSVYNYAYRVFTPSATGNYTLGMTDANYDPVMILYSGLTSFPANPATGAIGFNDDGDWSQFSGRTPTPGDYESYMPLLLDQPMTAGTNYLVAISTYSPGQTVQLPASFFLAGPGAAGLDGAPATPATPALYWLGSAGDSWTAANNWSSNATGTPTGNFTASSDIVFSADNSSNETSTNLGGDQTIASITVNTTRPVGISGGNLTVSGATTINTGTLTIGNGSTTGALIGDITNNATLAFNRSDASTYSGEIDGTGNVNKLGNGTLTLVGNNTYTGGTTLAGGTLSLGSAFAIGTSGNISFSGGSLQFTAYNTTDYSARFSQDVNQAYAIDTSDSDQYIILNSALTSDGGSLTKQGAGTLVLTGTNTYTGNTSIISGTLVVSGLLADSSNVSVATGATYQVDETDTIGSIAGNGTINLNQRSLTAGGSNSTTTFSGVMLGEGSFTKAGTGTLTLSGNNTYTGDTTLAGGTLSLGSNQALDTVGTLRFSGGILQFTANNTTDYSARFSQDVNQAYAIDTNGQNIILASNLTSVGGSLTKQGTGTLTLTGTNSYTGNTSIHSGTLVVSGLLADSNNVSVATGATYELGADDTIGSIAGDGTINLANYNLTACGTNGNTTFSGVMAGTGSFTKAGTGTLTLSGNNTYTGGTTLAGGTLSLGSNEALGTEGTLSFSGGSLQFTANNTTDYSARFSQDVNQAYAIDTNGQNIILANVLTSAGGSLTKQGTGTLTLTGNNTYTGSTTIDAGALQIGNGSNSASISQSSIGYLGFDIGSNGMATVSTGGTWTTTGDLFVGYAGNGNLTVSGGTVSNVNGVIGAMAGDVDNNIAGSNGTVTISGGNWTNSGSLTIGSGGTGSLTVNAGNVSNVNGAIGYESSATISGGNWTNSGDLDIAANANSTLTITGGLVTVAGTLTKAPAGKINLNAGGTLSIGAGGTTGGLITNGDFTYNGTLIFNRTEAYTYSGNLGGSGSLIKEGSNALILTGTNTYTGTTTINAGTLQIGNSAFTGSISSSSNIINNAILDFKSSNNQSYGGQISGSGTLNKRQGGTLILSGNNTYTGDTTIHAGTLQIGDGGASGSLVSNISGGALVFNRSDSSTYGGVFSGSTLTKLGAGALTLSGNNTYTGSTTISAGTLQIGAGGTSGAISNSFGITNNANLAFNRSDATSYSGAISGSGNLTQLGSGTLSLTGANTYNGATTVSAGTLQIGAGGTTGSLASDITNNAALVFNRSNASSYSGIISGNGTVTQSGAGALTLSGNNTYTGATAINAGKLLVNGNLASSATTVNTGGTLGGIGTLGAVTINSGGTIAPGNSPGTITVGNSVWNGGGIYNWELGNANGTAGTDWDLISSTGSLTINATSSEKFVINATALADSGFVSSTASYKWQMASFSGNITGFSTEKFAINASGFDSLPGVHAFSVSANSTALNLNYRTLFVWDAGNGTWSTDTNWLDNALPVNGAPIEFAGLGGTSTNNDYLTSISGLTFTANATQAYTLAGGNLSIGAGGIVNDSSYTQTLGLNIALGANQTFAANTANLVVSGNISGDYSLTKAGNETLTLSGSNTYTGGTTITAGTLSVTGSLNGTSSLDINAGSVNANSGNLTVFGNISVGESSSNNTLQISNGGAVIAASMSAGHDLGANNNQVTVGANSTLALADDIYIGVNGSSNSLTVTNGGAVSAFYMSAGRETGSNDNQVTVGANSTLTLTDILDVGFNGSSNNLTITNGGAVSANYTSAGREAGSNNNMILVTSNASMLISNDLIVGEGGSTNSMTVSEGGRVASSVGYIGKDATSTDNTVTVTGTNSTWTNNGTLHVGYEGSNNILTVVNNGTVSASSISIATQDGSGGTLNIGTFGGNDTGGTINASSIVFGSGTGKINFNQSNAMAFSGNISGSGSVSQLGNSTTILTGANTYAGGTTVNAGTLSITGNVSGTEGVSIKSGTLAVQTGGLLLTGNGGNLSVGDASGDNGTLQISGGSLASDTANIGNAFGSNGTANMSAGTWTTQSRLSVGFGGTGVLNLSGGFVSNDEGFVGNQDGSTGVVNMANGTWTNDSFLDIGGSGTGTLNLSGGSITAANGSIAKYTNSTGIANITGGSWFNNNSLSVGDMGNGTLNLYGGILSVGTNGTGTVDLAKTAGSSGTLNWGNGTSVGSLLAGGITGGAGTAVVNLNFTGNSTIGAVLAGGLSLNHIGTGTSILTANNTHTGVTTISSGTLQLGNGGTSGAIAGNIVNNAVLALNRSDDLTFNGIVSGTGTLEQRGTGKTTLVGNNTYTGGTTVNSGTLAGTTSSLQGAIANNSTVSFNQSTNGTYAGAMSGNGVLVKNGTGTVTMSGANSYTGGTTVNAGTLSVSGTVAAVSNNASFTVESGGVAGSVNNSAGAIATNNGTAASLANAGTFTNSGNITGNAMTIGTLASTGRIGGALSVGGGEATIDGTVAGSTVVSGGVLQGTGTLSTLEILSGGTVAPGTVETVGMISVSNMTLNGGAIYNWQTASINGTAGTSWDLISSAGALTLNATELNPITISMTTLGSASLVDVKKASWEIGNFDKPVTGFAKSAFTFNATSMAGNDGRYFMSLGSGNTTLVLNYKSASTWNTGSGNWTSAMQWENEALPENGDEVEFAGSGGTSTNNFATGNLSSISGFNFVEGAGAYTVSGNTLQIGEDGIINASSNLQTIAMDLTAGEILAVNTAVAGVEISGVISGNSALTKSGNQTLTLSGNNTYTGGTLVSAGTLAGTTQALQGAIINNAVVNFNQSFEGTYAGAMSGTGSLTKSGSGMVLLSGNNTYSGGTTINSGVLAAAAVSANNVVTLNPNAFGTGSVNINSGGAMLVPSTTLGGSRLALGGDLTLNNGTIAFYDIGTSPAGQDLRIDVAGNFTNAGNGVVIDFSQVQALDSGDYTLVSYNGTNFATSAISSRAGVGTTLQGSFSMNGSSLIYTVLGAQSSGTDIQNNGGPNTPIVSNYTINQTGVVTIGVNNTVSALTFNSGGTLNIQSNGVLNITSGTLNVQNGSSVVGGGTLVAPAGLNKDGTGELDFTNNVVVTGTAAVNAGLLSVNGQLQATDGVVVNPAATLGGSGLIVGNVNINGGNLSPGNSPGTLSVAGNLVLTGANATLIEIQSPTNFDRIVVSGTATLGGTLNAVAYGGGTITPGARYEFLQAGSITGEFDSLIAPEGLRIRFLNSGTIGTLLFGPESFVPFALNQNQRHVAKALDSFVLATEGDAVLVGTALDSLTTEQFPAAFDQIMPGFYESLGDILIEQTYNQTQLLTQRLGTVRLGAQGFQAIGLSQPIKYDKDGTSAADAKTASPIVESAIETNWNAWVMANGEFSISRGLAGVPNYNNNAGGFLVGADYRLSENFVAGLFAGYEYSYAKYDGGSSTRGNSALFGLYGSYTHEDGYYADAIVSGGYTGFQTRRSIEFGTIDRTASADPNSGQFSAALNLGKDFEIGKFTLGPIIGAQYTYAGIGGFTETGAESLDLALGQQNANSLRSNLGARFAYNWEVGSNITLIPEVRAFWMHEFLNNSRNISSALDGGNGASFDYETEAPYRNSVFGGVGVSAKVGDRWNASVFYNVNFGSENYSNNIISTSLGFSF